MNNIDLHKPQIYSLVHSAKILLSITYYYITLINIRMCLNKRIISIIYNY